METGGGVEKGDGREPHTYTHAIGSVSLNPGIFSFFTGSSVWRVQLYFYQLFSHLPPLDHSPSLSAYSPASHTH